MFQPQVTPEWRRPASNRHGSSGSPVARRPFEVAESSLNRLSSVGHFFYSYSVHLLDAYC
jgi:hypothetical protein